MEVIDVNKNVLSEKKEFEIMDEIIVPDSKPDMVSVICANGLWYVHKKEISNGFIKLDGNVQVNIAYLSSNGDTRGIETTLNFSYKLENLGIKENSKLKYELKIKEINTKLLNERKMQIFVKFEIQSKVYEKQEVKFNTDFEDIEGLQKQEENLEINSIVGYGTANASIDEKIDVQNLDKILDILKTDINLSNIESKMSYNKILAKAELKISIIYLTEDERIEKAEANFPVMSFVEIPNIKDDNQCSLDYKMKDITLKIINDDTNGINCKIDFEITAEVFAKKNIKIINDMYSLKSDLEFEKNEIELELNENKETKTINIDEKIEIANVKKVLQVSGNPIISNSPEMELTIYYETTEKSGLNVKIVKIPIMIKIEKDEEYKINILNNEFGIEGNQVIIKMEIEINEILGTIKKIPLIQEVKTIETETKDDYSVVIYFVKPNDSLWKIAKKFKVSVESLSKINNLENPDLIYPGDKLYVLK